MGGGGVPMNVAPVEGGFLTGKRLIFPLCLVTSLFFLWGFSYGLLDVLNKHFQNVLGITRLESTGLQVMYFGGGYLIFSPIAAEVLKRKGYKVTIIMGLCLYSLGAVFFWPAAHFATKENAASSFGGFLACTLVIACGLATLETSANSYAVVIGDPAWASTRLQFCQSWNGIASFVGPLIASKYFFSGPNANSLSTVQYVYLAVALLGVAVGIMFFFAKLPEVAEASGVQRRGSVADDATLELATDANGNIIGAGPIWKQYNMIFGFIAQFCYVGAQVACAALFVNYAHENGGVSDAEGAQMLSYALITFTVGRFVATGLSSIFESNFLLVVYAICAIGCVAAVCSIHGVAGVAVLIVVFFFMAPMYPTLFTLGTANLGPHTRRGAGILVMGVSGGAVFPPIQAAIADAVNTRISYVVPLVGFCVVLAYTSFHWARHGFHILRVKSDAVIAVSMEGGAVGGVIQTVHYDEKRLSVSAIENIRRSSIGAASVKGATGGVNFR
jgi:FHS family L-fucose permease-like MFS transporter